jgi:pilus assembly protein CpaB
VPRRLILIVVAIMIAGGTFLLIQRWIQASASRRPAAARPPAPVIHVLVARTAVSQGTLLTADQVRWQTWPADDPPGPYLVEGKWRLQDVVGAVPRANLSAGEPLTAEGLARPGDRSVMAAALTPGYRAITVNVTPATGDAGFVAPGDRVDLIVTLTLASKDKDGGSHHVSETVLRDVRVMGLDQTKSAEEPKPDKKGDTKEAAPPKTATLEVTPKQAEIVAVAADFGVLSLSLRSLGRTAGDEATDAPTHTWDSEAAQGLLSGPPSDHPRRTTGPAQPWSRVVVVRGGAVTEMMMSPRSVKAAATP